MTTHHLPLRPEQFASLRYGQPTVVATDGQGYWVRRMGPTRNPVPTDLREVEVPSDVIDELLQRSAVTWQPYDQDDEYEITVQI